MKNFSMAAILEVFSTEEGVNLGRVFAICGSGPTIKFMSDTMEAYDAYCGHKDRHERHFWGAILLEDPSISAGTIKMCMTSESIPSVDTMNDLHGLESSDVSSGRWVRRVNFT